MGRRSGVSKSSACWLFTVPRRRLEKKGNVGIEFGGLEQGYPHDNMFSHYFLSICTLTPEMDTNIAVNWFSRYLYYVTFITVS